MRVTYNWISDFLDLTITPQEIAEKLTLSGTEVTSVESYNDFLKDVIVSEIKDILPVVDSDKLSLCKVFNGSETLDIICGAKNMKKGDKVALATIGAVLPKDFKIKKSKIRGVTSYGMLCSEKELGFSEESSGIMILDDNLQIGKTLGEALNLFDTVIEYEITPNRGDCLSIVGIARELSALTGVPMKFPEFTLKPNNESIKDYIQVEIVDPSLCPRYSARLIKGVTIKDSPLWMKNRLSAVGLRPINNIVDITNYVMYEMGQPLHAFDYSFINGKKIIIRKSQKGYQFKTLDSKTHELKSDNLLICDAEKPIALAGVMGGENSEVIASTKDILLESAFFDPINIRKTAKFLNIQSEAAVRFEKAIDIEAVDLCSKRASYFMQELAGGAVVSGVADIYPGKKAPKTITLRKSRLDLISGIDINFETSKNILYNLGFKKIEDQIDKFTVTVPSFRNDVSREIDLIEEILRVYGYDKIVEVLPSSNVYPEYKYTFDKFINDIKLFFIHLGFSEAINYSFIGSYENSLFNYEKRRETKLLNPLTTELEVLRCSILPGLLRNIKDNFNQKNINLKFFEIGKIFFSDERRDTKVNEIFTLSAVAVGKYSSPNWCSNSRDFDFFDLKGITELFLKSFNIKDIKFVKADRQFNFLNSNNAAVLYSGDSELGFFGEVTPEYIDKAGIESPSPIFAFSINLENIFNLISFDKRFNELPKFPSVERDLALLADEGIPSEDIITVFKGEARDLLENVFVFDLYKGKNIESGKKSIGYKMIFRDKKGTLKTEHINKIIDKIILKLKNDYQIEIR